MSWILIAVLVILAMLVVAGVVVAFLIDCAGSWERSAMGDDGWDGGGS